MADSLSASNPGKMYGFVKTHYDINPVRQISMIGAPEYQLANKVLDAIIKPYIPRTCMLKSNKQFLDRFNNF